MNDLYTLDLSQHDNLQWDVPLTYGQPPTARESHSAVLHTAENGKHPRLFIYGGMSGCRLGDVYILDVGKIDFVSLYHSILPTAIICYFVADYLISNVNVESCFFVMVILVLTWYLILDKMLWSKPVIHGIAPLPRSLHTAVMIGKRYVVFGIPLKITRIN